MSKDAISLFILRTITNLHVGNGEANYNIIDNEVQRDMLSKYPTIYASSLKGALKEYFRNCIKKESKLIDYCFGSDKSIGHYNFMNAKLLSIPVRSDSKQFYRAVSPAIIAEFISDLEDFKYEENVFKQNLMDGSKKEKSILQRLKELNKQIQGLSEITILTRENTVNTDVNIELQKAKFKTIKNIEEYEKIFGENIVIMSNKEFNNYIKYLPVIARNCLENGQSKNLWYEEVVPRESRFYFLILQNGNDIKIFNNGLVEKPIQIGANSSIGYGFCKIMQVGGQNE